MVSFQWFAQITCFGVKILPHPPGIYVIENVEWLAARYLIELNVWGVIFYFCNNTTLYIFLEFVSCHFFSLLTLVIAGYCNSR